MKNNFRKIQPKIAMRLILLTGLLVVGSIANATNVRLLGSVSFKGEAQAGKEVKVTFQNQDTTIHTDAFGLYDVVVDLPANSGLISVSTTNCIDETVSRMAFFSAGQRFISIDFNLCQNSYQVVAMGKIFYHTLPAWGVEVEFSINNFQTILERTTTASNGRFFTYLPTGPHESGKLMARIKNCNGGYNYESVDFFADDTVSYSMLKCKPPNQSLVTGDIRLFAKRASMGEANLLLFKLNEQSMMIELVDSKYTESGGGYSFFVEDTGKYLIKVNPHYSNNNLFPYYAHGSTFWNEDPIVTAVGGQDGVVKKNIQLDPVFVGLGESRIEGKVNIEPGHDFLQSKVPVMLLDEFKTPITYTYLNEENGYSFENIPEGNYLIWIDEPGKPTTPLEVVIDEQKEDLKVQDILVDASGIYPDAPSQTQTYFLQNEVRMYPNPFGDNLRIDIEGESCASVSFSSVSGELIRETETCSGEMIGTSDLPAGVYLVTIQTENNIYNQRMMRK